MELYYAPQVEARGLDDILTPVWAHSMLESDAKRSLRLVSKCLCQAADGLVSRLDMQQRSACSQEEVRYAGARWPNLSQVKVTIHSAAEDAAAALDGGAFPHLSQLTVILVRAFGIVWRGYRYSAVTGTGRCPSQEELIECGIT